MSENDGKVPLPDLEGNGAMPPVDPNFKPKKLKKGSSVGLFISKGPTLVPVPDLTNMPGDKAQGAIVAAGLVVGNIDKPFNVMLPVSRFARYPTSIAR